MSYTSFFLLMSTYVWTAVEPTRLPLVVVSMTNHPSPPSQLVQDPDAYFSHPVGFISYDRDIPQSLLDAAAKVRGIRSRPLLHMFVHRQCACQQASLLMPLSPDPTFRTPHA